MTRARLDRIRQTSPPVHTWTGQGGLAIFVQRLDKAPLIAHFVQRLDEVRAEEREFGR